MPSGQRIERNNHMLRVAVTGGAGTGKSLVCRFFGEMGAKIIDLDRLAREVVSPQSPAFDAIVAHFGGKVLDSDGNLDRGRLRRMITRDAGAKEKLEEITHPEIFRRLEDELEAISATCPDAVVVVEVPLLVETGAQDRFDVVVVVEADEESQKRRIMSRDGCSFQDAQDLVAAQASPQDRRRFADYLIENVDGSETLRRRVGEVYRQISAAS